ncbi:TcaA NTF2-like domain-containing protein [Halalkalibacter lacteus]|uniref:TcaA NTF2-like domain-containing protein n=1 Tax=Halalkalibacter lacteus TaxID=3090663 RepID=UPI002FC912F1
MRIISFIIMIVLFLTACSSEAENLTIMQGQEAEEVATFLRDYKENMIQSVNTGDFNNLEPYLITNNSFYHSLRRYTSDLHSEGTTKELDKFDVKAVYEDEIGELHVDVDEGVTLYEHGQEKKIERSLRFELVRGAYDSIRIVTIKERK